MTPRTSTTSPYHFYTEETVYVKGMGVAAYIQKTVSWAKGEIEDCHIVSDGCKLYRIEPDGVLKLNEAKAFLSPLELAVYNIK